MRLPLTFRPSRSPVSHLLVYGFYLAVALFITWPLITVFSDRLLGHPFGDAYEYVGLIWWYKYALQTGQPIFFHPLFAYPEGLPGNWLWSIPLQSFPAWLFAFILPLPTAFNLTALLRLALNGWSLYWLLWKWTDRRGAALVAGTIFMAYPTVQGQLAAAHIGLLALWPVPFTLYALDRLRQSAQKRWIIFTAVCFVLGLLGNSQLLIYTVLPATAWYLLTQLRQSQISLRSFRQPASTHITCKRAALGRMLVALALGGLLSLIFLIPAAAEILTTSSQLRERGDVVFSADLLAIVSPSFMHPWFSGLEYPHRVLGVDPFEKVGYMGIIAGGLALIGVWKQRAARVWLGLAVLAWLLSLGPLLKVMDAAVRLTINGYETRVILPWALAQSVPLLNIVRVAARFNFTVALAVAIMAGYGLAGIVARNSTQHSALSTQNFKRLFRYLLPLVLVAAVLWEYRFWWPELPTVSGLIPAPMAALSERADVRAVLDIPWSHLLTDREAMYLQTAHHKPLIAGHITRGTPVSSAKLALLQETLDPALLNAAGVDVIIVHREWDENNHRVEQQTREELGAPVYADERFAVFETPHTDAAPGFLTVTPPITELNDRAEFYLYAPEAGSVTFSGVLSADRRTVALELDSAVFQTWMVNSRMEIAVPLSVTAGYHTVALTVQPPCPVNDNPALGCRAVQLFDLALENFTPSGKVTRYAVPPG